MSMLMWCVSIGINIIWFAVLNASLKYRYSRGLTYVIELFSFWLANYVSTFMPYLSAQRSLIPIAGLLILAFIVYKETWYKTLLYFLLVILTAFLNDFLGTIYLPKEIAGDFMYQGGTYNYVYILYLSTGTILFFLLYILLNNEKLKLEFKEYLLFAGFPLSQIVLIHAWIGVILKFRMELRLPYFAGVAGICLFADVGLLFMVFYMSQRRQLIQENKQLEELVKNQESYYSSLALQYESNRRLRHDIDNQLLTVKSLVSEGETELAKGYIQELTEKTSHRGKGICENLIADAFLQSKLKEAEDREISINMSVQLENSIPISSIDIIRAMGNILDNAIEASVQAASPYINLNCHKSKDYLVIICENSYSAEKKKKRKRISGLDRGLGTAVLKSLADKYKGYYGTEAKENVFTAKLIMDTRLKDDLKKQPAMMSIKQ